MRSSGASVHAVEECPVKAAAEGAPHVQFDQPAVAGRSRFEKLRRRPADSITSRYCPGGS